jgi:hypothetical protein
MFRLFKRKTRDENNGNGFTDKAAGHISRSIIRLQTQFANRMSRYEQYLSIRQKKIALVVFCISMGSFSGWLIYQGVWMKKIETPSYMEKNSIIHPENITLPDSLDLQKMENFKQRQDLQSKLTDSVHR